jgi:quercetin dioxygenase-like cupin family protein
MTIFDKNSEKFIKEYPDNIINGEYTFDFNDVRDKHILKMFHVELIKDQIIEDHSHNFDLLNIITYGSIILNEKNKSSRKYNKGDWYIIKKNVIYNIKSIGLTKMDCAHGI